MTRRITAVLSAIGLTLVGAGEAAAFQAEAPAASKARPFQVEQVGAFDEPWAIAFLSDGRALVTEKKGAVKFWQAGRPAIVVEGAPRVETAGQSGLFDIALAPDFARSRKVYLTFAEPRPGGSSLALARATLDPDRPAPRLENLEVIWRAGSDGKGGHYGGIIAFSPDGRYLFLTAGERQRFAPAQDMNQRLGKVLRLTLDGQSAPGNPWAGKTGTPTVRVTDPPKNSGSAASAPAHEFRVEGTNTAPAEIWTLGHRNLYGLAFAPDGRLWEVEMGPKGGDELNLIERGRNYGYPIVSNGQNYDDTDIPDHSTRPEFMAPALYWVPAISPGGFAIYNGRLFPQWKGSGFITALSGKALIRVSIDGARATKAEQWDMGTRIRDVAEAPDGSLYLLEDGGRGAGGKLMRLTPARR
jgi:glucose/arabinose dehydrogenase